MPSAWEISAAWNEHTFADYRKCVSRLAPQYAGCTDTDCADLSMLLLIEFAAARGLPLTFTDNDGFSYCSKTNHRVPGPGGDYWRDLKSYKRVVFRRIGTESLLKRNTVMRGPGNIEPGDLMMRKGHAALVFRVFSPGVSHPLERDLGIPDFPGGDIAERERNVWHYFRGTWDQASGKTVSRSADKEMHVDYLNWRTKSKGYSELLYFANVRQMKEGADGFRFYRWAPSVTDNWQDWDGEANPPPTHKVPTSGFN